MRIDVHVNFTEPHDMQRLLTLISQLTHKADAIMANLQEVTDNLKASRQELASVNTQLGKIGGETAATLAKATALEARVAQLEAIIAAGGNSSPELDAEVQGLKDDIVALKASAQAADDLTPDAPTP